MSQKSTFVCDGCNRPTGNVPHLSLLIQGGPATGVALPPGHELGSPINWSVKRDIGGQFFHFHNGDCAKKFFDKLLAKYKTEKKK